MPRRARNEPLADIAEGDGEHVLAKRLVPLDFGGVHEGLELRHHFLRFHVPGLPLEHVVIDAQRLVVIPLRGIDSRERHRRELPRTFVAHRFRVGKIDLLDDEGRLHLLERARDLGVRRVDGENPPVALRRLGSLILGEEDVAHEFERDEILAVQLEHAAELRLRPLRRSLVVVAFPENHVSARVVRHLLEAALENLDRLVDVAVLAVRVRERGEEARVARAIVPFDQVAELIAHGAGLSDPSGGIILSRGYQRRQSLSRECARSSASEAEGLGERHRLSQELVLVLPRRIDEAIDEPDAGLDAVGDEPAYEGAPGGLDAALPVPVHPHRLVRAEPRRREFDEIPPHDILVEQLERNVRPEPVKLVRIRERDRPFPERLPGNRKHSRRLGMDERDARNLGTLLLDLVDVRNPERKTVPFLQAPLEIRVLALLEHRLPKPLPVPVLDDVPEDGTLLPRGERQIFARNAGHDDRELPRDGRIHLLEHAVFPLEHAPGAGRPDELLDDAADLSLVHDSEDHHVLRGDFLFELIRGDDANPELKLSLRIEIELVLKRVHHLRRGAFYSARFRHENDAAV